MPTKIKSDYQPSQRVYELLKAYGIENPVEFVGHELPAFMMYWEDTGKAKASWDSTCLTWMKRTYEDKKHAMAQNRSYSGQQGNPFEKALDKAEKFADLMEGTRCNQDHEKCWNRKVKYKLPEPPAPGPAMSFDEAFAELGKILK